MKDKNGYELPPNHYELENPAPYTGEVGAKCHNCKAPLRGTRFTFRVYEHPGGLKPDTDRVQGPLCPNCSELPPDRLPSRRWMEDWW